jgi:phosphoglucomutase
MRTENLLTEVKSRARIWLEGNYDAETKKQVKYLLEHDEKALIDSFYRDLEFGTGGLRGIMGVGTNRMNIYTVGMATQGLSNYLKRNFRSLAQIKVVVGHDSRNNSRRFAETTANIFSANGFKVYLFDSLRPTPELSYAIRHFGCQSGVVITASHNPKEYNGYKAYWDDGGQIIGPHDKNIIDEVAKIHSIDEVLFHDSNANIEIIGHDFDEIYTDKIKELSLSPEIVAHFSDMKIVYTPIHGTGVKLAPMALRKIGFRNIINIPEQDISDGNFPTVHSPNPEETAALAMAIRKAEETSAELVMATDPDADRVGIAVKDNKGQYSILNGNQAASLLINYLLVKWAEKGRLKGKEYIVKTIVTTELLADIARKYNIPCYNVLTGFKYIADVIKQYEGKMTFIGGGEESYGYLAGEFVRDKDAIISCSLIAETAAWAKSMNKSLFEMLIDIYCEYGFYKEHLLSVTKKGKEGADEIKQLMVGYRSNPPATINGSKVIKIADYLIQKEQDLNTGSSRKLELPKSDVLQFFTRDYSKISIRPSGTEPKIKFYFSVRTDLNSVEQYEQTNQLLDQRIDAIIKEIVK